MPIQAKTHRWEIVLRYIDYRQIHQRDSAHTLLGQLWQSRHLDLRTRSMQLLLVPLSDTMFIIIMVSCPDGLYAYTSLTHSFRIDYKLLHQHLFPPKLSPPLTWTMIFAVLQLPSSFHRAHTFPKVPAYTRDHPSEKTSKPMSNMYKQPKDGYLYLYQWYSQPSPSLSSASTSLPLASACLCVLIFNHSNPNKIKLVLSIST